MATMWRQSFLLRKGWLSACGAGLRSGAVVRGIGVQESYQFVDGDRLIADFMADVMRVTGVDTGKLSYAARS